MANVKPWHRPLRTFAATVVLMVLSGCGHDEFSQRAFDGAFAERMADVTIRLLAVAFLG